MRAKLSRHIENRDGGENIMGNSKSVIGSPDSEYGCYEIEDYEQFIKCDIECRRKSTCVAFVTYQKSLEERRKHG